MPERAVWIDGRIRRGDEAKVSVFDRGARDGEGLFETLRVDRGRPFQWERHLERLVVSAAELGFPVPPAPEILKEGLAELLALESLMDAVARITVTRGIAGSRPTRAGCWIEVEPVGARLWKASGAAAVFSKVPFEPGALGRHKTTSRLAYHLAREEARSVRAHEAILVSARGQVFEGTVSNVFARLGEKLVTPPLDAGILPGVARAWVLAACLELELEVEERPLHRDELAEAREVFLTNSVQEVAPLATLEGRPILGRSLGEKLRDRYRAAASGGPG